MQTFMIYSKIYDSAMILDMQRLNKQILESDQMIKAELTNNNKFHKNHPVRKMWAKNIVAHKIYRDTMLKAWYHRGGGGTRQFYTNILNQYDKTLFPFWYNDSEILNKICQSHRKALLIKNFEYYKNFFPDDIDEIVLRGKDLKGYKKLITRGKNKGQVKIIKATQHKQEYIRDNNVYYWVNMEQV